MILQRMLLASASLDPISSLIACLSELTVEIRDKPCVNRTRTIMTFIVEKFREIGASGGMRRASLCLLVRSVTDDNNSVRRRDESNCRKEGPDTVWQDGVERDEEDVEREMARERRPHGTSGTTHN